LAQIGGPVAIGAMTEVMQTTTAPREIAVLAQSLAKLEPDLHTREALGAAHQTLAMAAAGDLPGKDVAPLFEVFQKFGDENTAVDLVGRAKQWNYYAPLALAQLPAEAGIPGLVRIASGENGSGADARTPALQTLTQVASQSAEARKALLEQVRENKLSQYDWATIVPFLAGDQMVYQNAAYENNIGLANPNNLRKSYLPSGNQSF